VSTELAGESRSSVALRDDESWFLHPEMARRVAEAEADFREGRATSVDTPDAAQTCLDGLKVG
jgi:hypothetical protein